MHEVTRDAGRLSLQRSAATSIWLIHTQHHGRHSQCLPPKPGAGPPSTSPMLEKALSCSYCKHPSSALCCWITPNLFWMLSDSGKSCGPQCNAETDGSKGGIGCTGGARFRRRSHMNCGLRSSLSRSCRMACSPRDSNPESPDGLLVSPTAFRFGLETVRFYGGGRCLRRVMVS